MMALLPPAVHRTMVRGTGADFASRRSVFERQAIGHFEGIRLLLLAGHQLTHPIQSVSRGRRVLSINELLKVTENVAVDEDEDTLATGPMREFARADGLRGESPS